MSYLESLLIKMGTDNKPEEVRLIPESYSQPENCFYNVLDKVKNDNGQILYGWKVHETPILLEAERHAVWISPAGELIDVTPDSGGQNSTLFIRDDSDWKYEGQFTDNVRINTTNNPLVDDLILLTEIIAKIWQTGRRESRELLLISEQAYKMIQFLKKDQVLREHFIYSNQKMNSSCYCGSLLEYKECHGKDLPFIYEDLLNHIK